MESTHDFQPLPIQAKMPQIPILESTHDFQPLPIQAKMPQIPSLIPRLFFATPRKKLWHRRRSHFI